MGSEYEVDTYVEETDSGPVRRWVVNRNKAWVAEFLNHHYAQLFADTANERDREFKEAAAKSLKKYEEVYRKLGRM